MAPPAAPEKPSNCKAKSVKLPSEVLQVWTEAVADFCDGIDILNRLRDVGLDNNFTVVGTNALYAYETAAGVRVDASYLATDDLDLLRDNRRKLTIAVPGALADGMIGLLRR